MCKRQFDLRNELNKHQCIDNNLRQLKKKKELRKRKVKKSWFLISFHPLVMLFDLLLILIWNKIRDAQWKRKIDLSYIETTSLIQLSQNIADNLSFCIDGTHTDLRAYSREVKYNYDLNLSSNKDCQILQLQIRIR